MPLKITRTSTGNYATEINGVRVVIAQVTTQQWAAHRVGNIVAYGKTKKEVISRLEIMARATKDRTKSDAHKIPGRKVLTSGTELSLVKGSLRGHSGRVRFIGYTHTNDGKEWLDVVDRNGRSRAVDPSKVKTVHRDRKMVI